MLVRYYIIFNLITLLVWGFDKLRAVQHGWRVSERAIDISDYCRRCFWRADRDAAVPA